MLYAQDVHRNPVKSFDTIIAFYLIFHTLIQPIDDEVKIMPGDQLQKSTQENTGKTHHETLVSVNDVSRYYGNNKAADNISFDVKRGEVLGLLGPNGAGKSTTMQMITGNLAPSNGQISICGFDILDEPKNAKNHLGYLPEHPPVYKELSTDEYLLHCAKINRIAHRHQKDAMKLAKERCGLEEVGNRLIGNLSKGYQQRIGIAQAIIHSPAVIILDEPTVGLDPIQIKQIRALIRELGNDHSIILSTHILPEVTATCDRVLIINCGKIMMTETIADLQQRLQSSSLVIAFNEPPSHQALADFEGVVSVDEIDTGRFRLHHDPEIDPSENIVIRSVKNNWRLTEIQPEKLSLEEIFLDITCTETGNEIDHIETNSKAEEIA